MKNNQQIIRDLIRRLSGQDNFLTIPRLYIDLTGEINAALFLNQCVYWSDRHHRQSGWFYKSYDEWQAELCLSPYQIKQALKKIEPGLIEAKRQKAPAAAGNRIVQVPTLWYRVNINALQKAIARFCESDENSHSGSEVSSDPGSEVSSDPNGSEVSSDPLLQRQNTKQRESAPPDLSNQESTCDEVADVALALAEVTGRDFELNRARLIKEARDLRGDLNSKSADVAGDLRAHYGAGRWWYKSDWRGQKGSAPRVANIRETWGQWAAVASMKTTKPKTMRR